MHFFILAVVITFMAVISDVESLPGQPDVGLDERRLFVFHTGSYNANESAWKSYPWSKIHTVLIYSQYPEMVKHARAAGANVAISTAEPSDLG